MEKRDNDVTFELDALSGAPSKYRNRCVVAFHHERAE